MTSDGRRKSAGADGIVKDAPRETEDEGRSVLGSIGDETCDCFIQVDAPIHCHMRSWLLETPHHIDITQECGHADRRKDTIQ